MNGYRDTVRQKLEGIANVNTWLTPLHPKSDKLNLAKGDTFHWKPEARLLQGKRVADLVNKALGGG